MRIGRITHNGTLEFAASGRDGSWVRLAQLGLDYPDSESLIADAEGIRSALQSQPVGGVDLPDDAFACPIVRPSKMLAVGLNYASHAKETGATLPERPLIFAKYPNSLTGPFADVEIGPRVTEQADYEVELAVIIGRTAKGVSEAEALDYVFGYAVANDVSARDWQRSDGQFSRSKSADTFCPIGPWITTADEFDGPGGFDLSSTVNGELRQSGVTSDMIFSTAQIISYLAATVTLKPGDVILTGTPPGVGLGFRPPRFLTTGDVVRCSISGLGSIQNRFVAS
ncbi:fumarylacetoacetate hydrolase family protein [Parafrigoribacterium mesophilum]|uniref:fumarylacetoacetate hydrolase family protein n=1 Tax=Parafrigoribacterium mesophilum TaxID=433646 RepID=UPI0031FD10F2